MLALDLQGTWGDIAGWTPYHDIVTYHHISLWVFLFLIANTNDHNRQTGETVGMFLSCLRLNWTPPFKWRCLKISATVNADKQECHYYVSATVNADKQEYHYYDA